MGRDWRQSAVEENDRGSPQGICPQSGARSLVKKTKGETMKKPELPRGLRWRGDSIVAVFALTDGSIERRALGEVSVSYAVEQLNIYRR